MDRLKQLCVEVGMTEQMMHSKVHHPEVVRLACADLIAQAIIEHSRSIDELSKVVKAKDFYKR